jgi:hypothetical protein
MVPLGSSLVAHHQVHVEHRGARACCWTRHQQRDPGYLSGEEVKEEMNRRLDDLYFSDNGIFKTTVCLICDRFLGPKEKEVSAEIRNCYEYPDTSRGHERWMDECFLSPRGCFCDSVNDKHEGFLVCSNCKHNLEQNSVPKYAIAITLHSVLHRRI